MQNSTNAIAKFKLIGLLGGTFDPIHLGHLYLATKLYQSLTLQEVRFIPSYQPLLRDSPSASAEERLTMIKLAIKTYPHFTVDNCEIERGGLSYTFDTLTIIKQKFPQQALCFMMGIDQFMQFDRWHKWREILNLAHLIIIDRPDYDFRLSAELTLFLKQHEISDKTLLTQQPSGYILLQTIKSLPISASDIRAQIHAGKNPQQLLPANVWKYICEKSLYR